jgi:hypothetical protein
MAVPTWPILSGDSRDVPPHFESDESRSVRFRSIAGRAVRALLTPEGEALPEGSNPAVNFFGVEASQPLFVWRAKGWIFTPTTLVVGFNGTVATFRGRRMEDDARQIGRWKAMRRHVRQIERGCEKGECSAARGSARPSSTGLTTVA